MNKPWTIDDATKAWKAGLALLVISLFLSPVNSADVDGVPGLVHIFCVFPRVFGTLHTSAIYSIATICAFVALYYCSCKSYIGQKNLPMFPVASLALGILFVPLIYISGSYKPVSFLSEIGSFGYLFWITAILLIFASSFIQRSIAPEVNEENITSSEEVSPVSQDAVNASMPEEAKEVQSSVVNEPPARVAVPEQSSAASRQTTNNVSTCAVVLLVGLSLLGWPIGIFISVFLWDSPNVTFIESVERIIISLCIWLYPVYIIPLMIYIVKSGKKK